MAEGLSKTSFLGGSVFKKSGWKRVVQPMGQFAEQISPKKRWK